MFPGIYNLHVHHPSVTMATNVQLSP